MVAVVIIAIGHFIFRLNLSFKPKLYLDCEIKLKITSPNVV